VLQSSLLRSWTRWSRARVVAFFHGAQAHHSKKQWYMAPSTLYRSNINLSASDDTPFCAGADSMPLPRHLPWTCRDVQSVFTISCSWTGLNPGWLTPPGREQRGSPQDHPTAYAHEKIATQDHRPRFSVVSPSMFTPAASQHGRVSGASRPAEALLFSMVKPLPATILQGQVCTVLAPRGVRHRNDSSTLCPVSYCSEVCHRGSALC